VGVLLTTVFACMTMLGISRLRLQARPDSGFDVKYDLADACFRKGSFAEAAGGAVLFRRQDAVYTFLSLLGVYSAHLGETARAARFS